WLAVELAIANEGQRLVEVVLLNEGQQRDEEREGLPGHGWGGRRETSREAGRRGRDVHARRKLVVGVVVVVGGQPKLFEVVGGGHAVSGFADLLDGGQEQANQDSNDGDDDEQFNQGEASTLHGTDLPVRIRRTHTRPTR